MTGTVHDFPARQYRPDTARIFCMIDAAGGEEWALLMLAMAGLEAVKEAHRTMSGAQRAQRVANGLGMTYFAVAVLLGIPRSDVEAALLAVE